jgi:uncharacterized protein YigA (DUF484 family)
MAEGRKRNIYDRRRVSFDTGKESLVQQNMKDKTDINKIMKKYEKTGLIDHLNKNPEARDYGDFTNIEDFQSAMIQVEEAKEAFMTLSASLRKRFNHDPGELIAFVADAKNKDEAIELGLIPKPVESGQPTLSNPPKEASTEAPKDEKAQS